MDHTMSVFYAMQFVGLPYRWGGKNPIDGFDCSGLVQEILSSAGIHMSGEYSAQMIYDFLMQTGGTIVSAADAGRIVFFGPDTKSIDHIGYLLDDTRMIESGGGDHTVVDRQTASAKNAFVKIKRYDVMHVAAIVQPKY